MFMRSRKLIYPPDQDKKEAQKRELRKKKEHHVMFRTSVLKMKEASRFCRARNLAQYNSCCQTRRCWKICKKHCRESLNVPYSFTRKVIQILTKTERAIVEYEHERACFSQCFDAIKEAQ